MIATRRFVFLHLHKSGGTFVNYFLKKYFRDAQVLGYHLPRAYLPMEFRDRPLLGTVRNPWDYYVSWYAFQTAMETPNALFRTLSDDRRLDASATIRNMITLGDQPELLARAVAALPEAFPNHGLNLTRRCLAPLAGSGLGFYSFLGQRMYGALDDVTLVRTDEMRTALPDALRALGVQLDATMLEYFHSAPALNEGRHAPYESFYDQGLRELVATWDAPIVARHGFAFGD